MRFAALVALPVTLLAGLPGAALADSHSLPIRNGSGESVTAIYMSPPGSPGTGGNRLRSTLPPGAEGTFTYSTGCRADIRLAYANGRSEDHPDVDICGGSRIIAGQDGTVGPAVTPAAAGTARSSPAAKPGAATTATAVVPPPVVPPWTGKSITKRFGGMD